MQRPERQQPRAWWLVAVAALALGRGALPLVVESNAGRKLPLMPAYDGTRLNGDANGFYEAVSNIIDASERVLLPHVLLVGAAAAALVAAATAVAARFPRRRWLALVGVALGASLLLTWVVADVEPPGAAVIGWPLLWTISLLGISEWRELTVDLAFPYALGLSVVANAATTVATAVLGLWATGRRAVGLAAAALWASWPLWVGLVAGEGAWENGQWHIDVGLHLYTEPVSTALVVVAAALLVKPRRGDTSSAAAGLLVSYATVVKLTNGVLALALLPALALRHGLRRALPYAVGGLVFAPIAVAYWPKGYVQIFDGSIAAVPRPWSLDYVGLTWRSSTIFTPGMLALIGVPALLGLAFVGGWYARTILVLPPAATAATYSLYYVTYQHPRFLYVALPFVLVLAAAGLAGAFRLVWERGSALAAPPEPRASATSREPGAARP